MSDNGKKQLPDDRSKKIEASDDSKLPTGDDEPKLATGDDIAAAALRQAANIANDTDDEVEASNQLAETLNSLQNLIERNATKVSNLKEELKEKRQSYRNFFDNDTILSEAEDEAEAFTQKVKERKSKLKEHPQVTSLKTEIKRLNEEKKDIEESLSNYLVNYHALTNSKSFDTSDGDQWEFKIKARIKTRRKRNKK